MNGKVVIYARKSSESEDRQIMSLDSQLREMNELTSKLDLQIYRTVSEAKSAKYPNKRDGFKEMVQLIETGKCDTVLTWHPDRLSRNPIDSAIIVDLMDRGLLKQIVTNSQTFHNTSMEKYMLAFFMTTAKFDNDKKGDDVKRGMKDKVLQGWYPYPALNGYLNTPERPKKQKIVVKDPERFPLVRKMWDMMLTGVYTVAQVHKIINEEWHYTNWKGKPFTRSAMYEMFSHPFYYGYFKYSDVWYKGAHEPMVTKEEWDKVQKVIHRPTVPHKDTYEKFLYVDLIKCGHCGFSITGSRKIKYYKRTKRTGEYVYYCCTHKNRSKPCKEQPVTEKNLENQFIGILDSVEIEQEFKDWAVQFYHELDEYEFKTTTDVNVLLQKQIEAIDKKQETLLDLAVNQSIPKEEYDKKRHELEAEKTNLQQKLTQPFNWVDELDKKLGKVCGIKAKYLSQSKEEKRERLREIGWNYFLENRLVRPELEKPFFAIAEFKKKKEDEICRLEPVDYPFLSPQTLALARLNPTWLPRVDSNH